MKFKPFFITGLFCLFCFGSKMATAQETMVRIKDLAEIRGVRPNPLLGLGLIVGLQGTGDSKASLATNRAVANLLTRLGMMLQENEVTTKNIAVVAVTAELPPFARIGDKLDIRVSSVGDAQSLEGGTLLLTPLIAADNKTYATAQGTISLGTAMAGAEGGVGRAAQSSAPKTVALARSGIVEREFLSTFISNNSIELSLKNDDFTTATRMANAINSEFHEFIADPVNSRLVKVRLPTIVSRNNPSFNPVTFVSTIEQLTITPDSIATIVINERTGTIIAGSHITVMPVAISHGRLEIEIAKKSQKVNEFKATTVSELVTGLNALGAGPKDVVSILKALEASKALKGHIKLM
ncbi:MAG: flagellar basal body P-ring protein FlgI [Silvanigrellaceae bacterium]|nr:flagellar basal body P-ring protein FlgI [Silvanigrellaceae bacterium]